MQTKYPVYVFALFFLYAMASPARATVITYDTWTTNEAATGNYVLTVSDGVPGKFLVNLTVDPWNAEALGLFIDFGNVDVGAVGLTDIVPLGDVSVFATDTTSDGCGPGCNLQGLNPPVAVPDGEWEVVLRLGTQGFNGIQTFGFAMNDQGLSLSDWGLVGIRAQNLCDAGQLLPDGSCGGSDKSYGTAAPAAVPEPASLLLLGSGMLGLGWLRWRKPAAS